MKWYPFGPLAQYYTMNAFTHGGQAYTVKNDFLANVAYLPVVIPHLLPLKCASAAMGADAGCQTSFGSCSPG